jgi:hypothetical protein
LWQAGNARNCSWSNVKQTFVGSGCESGGGAVQCACRHLTSFEGASKPSIPTCSLSDMLALKPGDLITKMKTLFIVVCVLFGGMCVGAAIGFVLDRNARQRRVVTRLQMPDTGFRLSDDGAWLWRFSLEALQEELAAPRGSAVVLSAIIGMPFARLRCGALACAHLRSCAAHACVLTCIAISRAIAHARRAALPDELVSTTMSEALGRRYAFSVSGMAATAPDMRVHLKALSKRWQRRHPTSLGASASARGGSRASSLRAAAAEEEAQRSRVENLEDLVGTALVLAYLQVTQLMPVMELAHCCSLAVKHFEHCRTPSGWTFTHMRITFLTLISPGILNVRSTWLVRARIWKCILGQSTEGWWDANHTSAFVLEARPPQDMERLTPTLITRISDFIRGAAQALTDEDEQTGRHVLTEAIDTGHGRAA